MLMAPVNNTSKFSTCASKYKKKLNFASKCASRAAICNTYLDHSLSVECHCQLILNVNESNFYFIWILATYSHDNCAHFLLCSFSISLCEVVWDGASFEVQLLRAPEGERDTQLKAEGEHIRLDWLALDATHCAIGYCGVLIVRVHFFCYIAICFLSTVGTFWLWSVRIWLAYRAESTC